MYLESRDRIEPAVRLVTYSTYLPTNTCLGTGQYKRRKNSVHRMRMASLGINKGPPCPVFPSSHPIEYPHSAKFSIFFLYFFFRFEFFHWLASEGKYSGREKQDRTNYRPPPSAHLCLWFIKRVNKPTRERGYHQGGRIKGGAGNRTAWLDLSLMVSGGDMHGSSSVER
jgi:hypothetical protein